MEIKLNLTIEEANIILNSLAQAPYTVVHKLISKIQAQAQDQMDNELVEEVD